MAVKEKGKRRMGKGKEGRKSREKTEDLRVFKVYLRYEICNIPAGVEHVHLVRWNSILHQSFRPAVISLGGLTLERRKRV